MKTHRISLGLPNPEKACRIFVHVMLVLLFAHLAATVLENLFGIDEAFGLLPLFHFDAEQNLPTFYSVVLILLAACCMFAAREQSPVLYKGIRFRDMIGILLILLATDEFASIHERIGGSLALILPTDGIFHHTWLIPYLCLGALLAPLGLQWFVKESRSVQFGVALGGCIFLLGAVGLEMISGLVHSSSLSADMVARITFATSTFEELLEMTGMLVVLITMYRELLAIE